MIVLVKIDPGGSTKKHPREGVLCFNAVEPMDKRYLCALAAKH